jgi:hypothetical protein
MDQFETSYERSFLDTKWKYSLDVLRRGHWDVLQTIELRPPRTSSSYLRESFETPYKRSCASRVLYYVVTSTLDDSAADGIGLRRLCARWNEISGTQFYIASVDIVYDV